MALGGALDGADLEVRPFGVRRTGVYLKIEARLLSPNSPAD
jgi:hypothetical protein